MILTRGEYMTIHLNFIMMINLIVLFGTLFLCASGYKHGFLFKILSCISFVVIVFVAWNLAELLKFIEIIPKEWAPFMDTNLAPYFYGLLNKLFIFVVFVIIFSLLILILRPIAKVLGDLPIIHSINRLFGLIFGLVQSAIIIFVVTFLLTTPLFTNGNEIIQGSVLKFVEPIQKDLFELVLPSMIDYQMIRQINEAKTSMENLEQLEMWLNQKGFSHEDITEFLLRLTK